MAATIRDIQPITPHRTNVHCSRLQDIAHYSKVKTGIVGYYRLTDSSISCATASIFFLRLWVALLHCHCPESLAAVLCILPLSVTPSRGPFPNLELQNMYTATSLLVRALDSRPHIEAILVLCMPFGCYTAQSLRIVFACLTVYYLDLLRVVLYYTFTQPPKRR